MEGSYTTLHRIVVTIQTVEQDIYAVAIVRPKNLSGMAIRSTDIVLNIYMEVAVRDIREVDFVIAIVQDVMFTFLRVLIEVTLV